MVHERICFVGTPDRYERLDRIRDAGDDSWLSGAERVEVGEDRFELDDRGMRI